MKREVLHTVWCNISGEAAGEIWHWSLLRVKGLIMRVMSESDWSIQTLARNRTVGWANRTFELSPLPLFFPLPLPLPSSPVPLISSFPSFLLSFRFPSLALPTLPLPSPSPPPLPPPLRASGVISWCSIHDFPNTIILNFYQPFHSQVQKPTFSPPFKGNV